mmetsp:Transcript_78513/g.91801  ORF Transcript_78513/g.91801 Transcript_78513/m.91801 type:complete len:115 (-) Transcript_78513:188-532(-)
MSDWIKYFLIQETKINKNIKKNKKMFRVWVKTGCRQIPSDIQSTQNCLIHMSQKFVSSGSPMFEPWFFPLEVGTRNQLGWPLICRSCIFHSIQWRTFLLYGCSTGKILAIIPTK